MRIESLSILFVAFLSLSACSSGEEPPEQGENSPGTGAPSSSGGTAGQGPASGGATSDGSGGSASGGADSSPSTGGSEASGGATGSGGSSATGGQSPGEEPLVLEGAPPERQEFLAKKEHWELLPDDEEFTNFAGESPFFIAPLRDENFPTGFDYCTAAGGDAELNMKQQMARARLKAQLKTWYYDVTLRSVPEEDGITPYELVIDGEVVREFSTPEVGTQGAVDREVFLTVWEGVPIKAGQSVEIRSRAHSNFALTEAAGCRSGAGFVETYAWARARFDGLAFEAGSVPE